MKFYLALAWNQPSELLPLAAAADKAGFDGVALSDHLVFPATIESRYPYAENGKPHWLPTTPWPDVWVTCGFLASMTSRIRFLTNIYVLPSRDPFVVAKAVGTVAVLSGNRGVARCRRRLDEGRVRSRRQGLPHARAPRERDDRRDAGALDRRDGRVSRRAFRLRATPDVASSHRTRPDFRRRLRARRPESCRSPRPGVGCRHASTWINAETTSKSWSRSGRNTVGSTNHLSTSCSVRHSRSPTTNAVKPSASTRCRPSPGRCTPTTRSVAQLGIG